ncbi:MAG: HAD family hydrolase [Clostridia bacterium]|nr:HAD family hydrolase [Clostridia bacterium]
MEKQAFAFFDFDGTLIPGDSIAAFVRYARKRGIMPRRDFCRALLAAAGYVLGLVSAADSKNAALRFRMRLSPADREALDRDFVRDCLLPRVYPQAQACLDLHRQAGRETVLVTASTENYMQIVADELGFSALLATPLRPDGTVGENCKGEEKPRRIRAWLREQNREADFAASFAYGDSKSDLPMLLLCGHPVQVNPKKALRKAAPEMETVGWNEKRHFKSGRK